MFKFGKKSLDKLSTVHPELQDLMNEAIKRSPIDFSIICGKRSIEKQKSLYLSGKSKINGITRKSKHNSTPSLGIDFMPIINGRGTFKNMNAFAIIVGVILSTAKEMDIKTRSGITFGSKTWQGWDAGHVEIKVSPSVKLKKRSIWSKLKGK